MVPRKKIGKKESKDQSLWPNKKIENLLEDILIKSSTPLATSESTKGYNTLNSQMIALTVQMTALTEKCNTILSRAEILERTSNDRYSNLEADFIKLVKYCRTSNDKIKSKTQKELKRFHNAVKTMKAESINDSRGLASDIEKLKLLVVATNR